MMEQLVAGFQAVVNHEKRYRVGRPTYEKWCCDVPAPTLILNTEFIKQTCSLNG